MTRAFHFRDRFTLFIRLNKQYDLSHLEFASCVWNPWTKSDCDVLERVQMRAVSFISGLKGSPCEEKLKDSMNLTISTRIPGLKELSFCHKLKFSNPSIFAT